MKVYLLDVDDSDNSGVRDLFGNKNTDAGVKTAYETYTKLLKCDLIDIVTRKIGGIWYDLIVDDEGLYQDNPKVSVLTKKLKPAIWGNVIITRSTPSGNQSGLKDSDIEIIKDNIAWMTGDDGLYNILMGMEYE